MSIQGENNIRMRCGDVPGAGQGKRAGVAQVGDAAGQVFHRGVRGRAGSQSSQLKLRVHAAGGRRETPHLALQLPTHGHHIAPPSGGTRGKGVRRHISFLVHIKRECNHMSVSH